jgi:hypothetical protein
MQVLEEQAQARWLSRLFTLMVSAWTALLFVSLINLFVYNSPRQDQTSYLYWAQRVMSGAQVYGPQLVETNPPLIIWFSTIPVFLAHLLHLNSLLMLKLVVAAMILGSLAWSRRILRSAHLADSPATLYLAIASFLSAELFLRGFDVGQREHLLFILIVPYILSRVCGDSSRLSFAELCAVGAIGGAAVCFKPQQVLILVALELFIVAWTRSLRRLTRPDLLCAVLAVFTYVAVVRLATPYFSAIVPLLRETYWAMGPSSALRLIEVKSRFNLILLLAIVVFLWRRHSLRFGVISGAFLACCLASSVAFYAQHTGWTYQAYPFEAFLLLAVLWIAIDLFSSSALASGLKFNSAFAASTLVFLLVFLAPLMRSTRHTARFEAAHKPYLDAVLEQYPPQTPVAVLSASVDAFPILPHHHLTSASRFAHLWMLPAIVQNEVAEAGGPAPGKVLPPVEVERLAALQRTDVVEDFQQWKPAVVIVRQCPKSTCYAAFHNSHFDYLAWFEQSPEFAAEWQHYRFQSSDDGFAVYTRTR